MTMTADAQRLHTLLAEANTCLNEKRYAKARKLCEEALAFAPNSPDAHMLLAGAHEGRGDAVSAINEYRKAIEIEPEHLASWVNLGVCQKERGHIWAAVDAFRSAYKVDPSSMVVQYNLARALFDAEMYLESIVLFERLLEQRPGWADVRRNVGNAYLRIERYDEAIESYKKAIKSAPDLAASYGEMGYAYAAIGSFDDAEKTFREALEKNPELAMAYSHLARIGASADQRARDLEAVQKLLQRSEIAPSGKSELHYAAFFMHEKDKRHDEAFENLTAANRLRAEEYPFTTGSFTEDDARTWEEKSIAMLDADFYQKHLDVGVRNATPIFVVGMPRSGTTLTEQIIASHPRAAGAGELSAFPSFRKNMQSLVGRSVQLPDELDTLGPDDAQRLANAYTKSYPDRCQGAEKVVDKAPLNIFFVGLIKSVYPEARIVMCRRRAMDTCWSNYTAGFAVGQVRFAQNFDTVARTYARVSRLIDHWAEVFPETAMILDYEELVQDFEPQARRLIDFIGLEWDDACLSFHEHQGSVNTASYWQVRQPLYKTSVARWKPYEKHLGPLREALETYGVAVD